MPDGHKAAAYFVELDADGKPQLGRMVQVGVQVDNWVAQLLGAEARTVQLGGIGPCEPFQTPNSTRFLQAMAECRRRRPLEMIGCSAKRKAASCRTSIHPRHFSTTYAVVYDWLKIGRCGELRHLSDSRALNHCVRGSARPDTTLAGSPPGPLTHIPRSDMSAMGALRIALSGLFCPSC